MPPLKYHEGQVSIQKEASTALIADNLAHWVGPVAPFTELADIILLVTEVPDAGLRFTVLSGEAPLVEVFEDDDDPELLRVSFPEEASAALPSGAKCGGLSINLEQARRARINGWLSVRDGRPELLADETFTLCRKYIAPSVALDPAICVGPSSRSPIDVRDPMVSAVLAKAQTSFLASVSPEGMPDVAHRGGPAGFIKLDGASGVLKWTEYLGDGIFKSAGNIRATGRVTMLVPDMASGDAVELVGRGTYTNIRTSRRQRLDPLVQDREPHPVQGVIESRVEKAYLLKGLMSPREPGKRVTITSCDVPHDQAPQ